MNPENIKPSKYKRYDEAFKRSAVELWLQGGKSVATIAAERCSATTRKNFPYTSRGPRIAKTAMMSPEELKEFNASHLLGKTSSP